MGQAQGTNDTPSPPSDIRKERCPKSGISAGFLKGKIPMKTIIYYSKSE